MVQARRGGYLTGQQTHQQKQSCDLEPAPRMERVCAEEEVSGSQSEKECGAGGHPDCEAARCCVPSPLKYCQHDGTSAGENAHYLGRQLAAWAGGRLCRMSKAMGRTSQSVGILRLLLLVDHRHPHYS